MFIRDRGEKPNNDSELSFNWRERTVYNERMGDTIATGIGFILISSTLYLAGKSFLVLLKLHTDFFEDIFYSSTLGILLVTLSAYVLSVVHISYLLLPLIILFILFCFVIRRSLYLPSFSSAKEHTKALLIVGVLSVIFSGIMLFTGKYAQAFIYRHDDPWHLALINELRVHFPPDNPGFAGIQLQGYHFFYDFFVAMLSNTFKLSPVALHFHIMPLLFSLLYGLGIYSLMYKWQKKKSVAVLAVFLGMFGGSFAFMLSPFIHTSISFDNGLGMTQPALTLYNPPLAISLIILLLALLSMYHYLSIRQSKWLVPLIFAVGLLPMFKIYGGIVLCLGFLVLTFLSLLRKRFLPLVIGIFAGMLILMTYGVFAGESQSIRFYPLWGPHSLLQTFHLYDFTVRHTIGKSIFSISQRIMLEVLGLLLFVVGNLGMRFVGILGLRKKDIVESPDFAIVLVSIGLASLILPLFFIQSLKEFEIIQFASYYLFIASLFSASGLYVMYERIPFTWSRVLAVLVFVLVTLPSSYSQYALLPQLIHNRVSLTSPSMKAVQLLASQGKYDDTVLELPPRQVLITDPELTIWYSTSTPLVIALANKRGYLNNEFIDFPNVDKKARIALVKQVINTQTHAEDRIHDTEEILKKNNIKYIYMTTEISEMLQSQYIHRVLSSPQVNIYSVSFN